VLFRSDWRSSQLQLLSVHPLSLSPTQLSTDVRAFLFSSPSSGMLQPSAQAKRSQKRAFNDLLFLEGSHLCQMWSALWPATVYAFDLTEQQLGAWGGWSGAISNFIEIIIALKSLQLVGPCNLGRRKHSNAFPIST